MRDQRLSAAVLLGWAVAGGWLVLAALVTAGLAGFLARGSISSLSVAALSVLAGAYVVVGALTGWGALAARRGGDVKRLATGALCTGLIAGWQFIGAITGDFGDIGVLDVAATLLLAAGMAILVLLRGRIG